MTNLDCVLKSRDITLPTKVHFVKLMFFFQLSCTNVRAGSLKKAEDQRVDAYEHGSGEDT